MADSHAHRHEGEANVDVHHEESDVNVRALLWFIVAFVVVMAIVFGAAKLVFDGFKHLESRGDVAPVTRVATAEKPMPPEPRLQANPARDMVAFRQAERKLLLSTEMIDPTTGQVRISIDRAIHLAAQRGIQLQAQPTRVDSGALTPASRNPMPADQGPTTGGELPPPQAPATSTATEARPQ